MGYRGFSEVQGIAGLQFEFTLGGTDAGPATTDSNGVAALTGISTSDAVGTYFDAVAVAYTGGNSNDSSSNGTGTLTVS